MESAVLGVILDSSVIIEAERQQFNVAQFLKQITPRVGDREAALSSIIVAELVGPSLDLDSVVLPVTHFRSR